MLDFLERKCPIFPEAKSLGLICPKHGLVFIEDKDFNQFYTEDKRTCPFILPDTNERCGEIGVIDDQLYFLSMLEGCAYCKKVPVATPFVYDNHDIYENNKVYCHLLCLQCARRKCSMRGCPATAYNQLYLIVEETPYLVPFVCCHLHRDNIEKSRNGGKIDQAMYDYICNIRKQAQLTNPQIGDCALEFKRY